jgi:hypothetical protein
MFSFRATWMVLDAPCHTLMNSRGVARLFFFPQLVRMSTTFLAAQDTVTPYGSSYRSPHSSEDESDRDGLFAKNALNQAFDDD